jgi:non-heme chloroperoxidase
MAYVVTSDGTPIYYIDEGPRSPSAVLLIHAEPFNVRLWARNITPLAQKFRVVAIDVRGRGESGKTENGQSIAQFARDLRLIIEHLNLAQIVVVGWSLGSSIVWSYIEQFGHIRLSGFVNVDQSPYRFVSEENTEARRSAVRNRRLEHHIEIIRNYLGPESGLDDDAVHWMAYECMKTHSHTHIAAITDSYRSDFRPHLEKISIPNQLYWSTYGTIKSEMAEFMIAKTPGCEPVFFKGCGHLIPWVQAERFNDELSRFVERVLS